MVLRNVVPRQGTEINSWKECQKDSDIQLRNVVPRQGTEMLHHLSLFFLSRLLRNVVPRQGTEIM